MSKEEKKKKEKTVKCPWGCKNPVPQKEYPDHLTKVHYKTVDKKLLGPFPAGIKEE